MSEQTAESDGTGAVPEQPLVIPENAVGFQVTRLTGEAIVQYESRRFATGRDGCWRLGNFLLAVGHLGDDSLLDWLDEDESIVGEVGLNARGRKALVRQFRLSVTG